MAKNSLIQIIQKYSIYSVYGFLELIYFFFKTKIFFKDSKLIRFPIFIRGREFIDFGKLMTTGRYCRIDAIPIFNYSRKSKLISFGSNVEIGDRVHIASVEGVKIGDRCLIASNIYISDHDHGKTNMNEMRNVPKNRFAKTLDFLTVIAYLSSDYSGYTTGQNIVIDGGLSLK